MERFENKFIKGVHASRYIASWCKVNGDVKGIKEWLKTLVINDEHLTDDEIHHIHYLATCGKLEFESSARNYLANK